MSNQIVRSVAQTIRFTKTDDQRIIVDEAVVSTFMRYAQNSPLKSEAGGLLLGRHLKWRTHIAVDLVSEPMRGDMRKRTSFFRGHEHERFAHKCWHASNATCAYLGNWHTHPEMNPVPSETDLYDWSNVLHNDVYEGQCLYFMIVGMKEIACWEGCRKQNKFTKLKEYFFS